MVEPTGASVTDVADYPAAWEADVVLHDGTTTRIRPIRPADADALQAFHVAQSERSTYFRFFHALDRLAPRDLERLVGVDYHDRVALVAVEGADERIIAVARFDRIDQDAAEVAFNIADAHQGKGLGSVLLEHLAAAARERGVRRFVAEVLPANGRMLAVFRDAGYEVRQRTEEGVVAVSFDIDPTDRSVEVMADREHTAEARSMRALFDASSVLVVGPGNGGRPLDAAMAERVCRSLGAEAAAGRLTVHAVGVGGDAIPGVAAWPTPADVPGTVDVAVLAGEADTVISMVGPLAPLGVRTAVVLSGGFAEEGPAGLERQRRLLRAVHGAGMRLVGPSSYGAVATGPERTLDLTLAEHLPGPGPVGLFCQSAPFSVPLLTALERRGLGLSQFLSAGHRADVSGNDLMQFWADDERTAAVGLYLESIGNPRKFSRVARRLAARKPVVVMTAAEGAVVPPGHAVRRTEAPGRAFAEMLRQSGVVRVENIHQMVDVLQLTTSQPLPAGRRVGILSSSQSVGTLVAALLRAHGLQAGHLLEVVAEDAPPERLEEAIASLYVDAGVDAVIAVRTPVMGGSDGHATAAVARAAAASRRTTVAVMTGLHGLTPDLTAPDAGGVDRTVPAYSTPADAVLALGLTVGYSQWRAADRGRPLHPAGVDLRAARLLAETHLMSDEPSALDPEATAALLATVGVRVVPSIGVHDADAAVAAADVVGYPVALKTTAPALRHRADLGGVRLDVPDEPGLRAAVAQVLAASAGYDPGTVEAPLQVQAMAEKGVACVLRTSEDPLFGPILSFGLGGDATELLDDVAYGVPPLTDADVSALVREPRAAVRLVGYRGLPAADVAALEDLVGRVAVLADGLPELRSLELNPVVAAPGGIAVLGARATLARADRADATRRLSRT
jgi:acyl-CoA synthetase (NDP forming)/RimJ/RimL family protein N-acetyltransferase